MFSGDDFVPQKRHIEDIITGKNSSLVSRLLVASGRAYNTGTDSEEMTMLVEQAPDSELKRLNNSPFKKKILERFKHHHVGFSSPEQAIR